MDFDAALAFIRIEIDKDLRGRFPVPQGYLRTHVAEKSQLAKFKVLDADIADRLIRHLETIYGTSQETGHTLKSPFKEWYPERRGEISFYYWRRLSRYWMDHSILPLQVVKAVDNVTDEILGYLGDPQDTGGWRRRGLVMGHVQSGKTTNYSALITKAADAGYRIIIVLAGLTNSLRYQTQIRLDQTFVGKSSLGDAVNSEIYPISNVFKGIDGEAATTRYPFCGTTQASDFNKLKASGIGASEGNFADPILFVTKKHEAVLASLADWLRELNKGNPLEGPLLLIDDEADNASVNTSKDQEKTTRINERIRDLLNCSKRSSYVGYTATPFANIFIDPDTTEDMLKEDLFPSHFIKSLEPPDNYIGAARLFADSADLKRVCVREIPDDYKDLLPLRHKSGHPLEELPGSLVTAISEYVLFRAIRVLTGDESKHSSMLVNVSRFNAVQHQVHDLIYRLLQTLKDSAQVWANSPVWDRSAPLQQLYAVWHAEYAAEAGHAWEDIRGVLTQALASIEVRLVNMRGGGLDYSKARSSGMHVIAVGGLALARGLTLEGLAVSYVLRNVGAADTLLQMGRWFGYRLGYERLCRIHAPAEMIEDFTEISAAVEELRDDLARMERMGRTPDEFGLKVRQSPTGIAITAANKMRTAQQIMMAVDLSGRHLQAFELPNDPTINDRHLSAVSDTVTRLQDEYSGAFNKSSNALVWSKVDVSLIQDILRQFELPQLEFATVREGSSLVLDYIGDRASSELREWDVAIPFKTSGFLEGGARLRLPMAGFEEFFCRQRFSGVLKKYSSSTIKVTAKNVVADAAPGDLTYGESEDTLEVQAKALKEENSKWSTEKCYLHARTRPLLVIHLFEFKLGQEEDAKRRLPNDKPVASFSLAFPDTEIDPQPRMYAASKRLLELLAQQAQEMDGDEDQVDGE